MRSDLHSAPLFIGGLAAGLVVAAVSLLTIEAARRVRARREATRRVGEVVFIDGVEPASRIVLEARPAEEGNSNKPPRLVSEMPEFTPMSQRW